MQKGLYPYIRHQVSCMRDAINGKIQFSVKYKGCFLYAGCGTAITRNTTSGKPLNPWIKL